MTVGPAVPQRESALEYSLPVVGRLVVSLLFISTEVEYGRTHASPLEDPRSHPPSCRPWRGTTTTVNHRIERLREDLINGPTIRNIA